MTLSNKELNEFKGENRCPHCDRTDWCYRIGELTVCNRQAVPADGWIKTSKCDRTGVPYYAPEQPKKAPRPKLKQEFVYCDRNSLPLVQVTRTDEGNGKKKFYQSHWDGKNWVTGLEDSVKTQVPIYRYKEVRAAIERGETIYWVEGEACADLLWSIGLAATTTLGGSGKYRCYGNYSQDLQGAKKIVLCPDRDRKGVEYMDSVMRDYPSSSWLFAPPSDYWWSHLSESGGLDIADWINVDKATKEQICNNVSDRSYLSSFDNKEPQSNNSIERSPQSVKSRRKYTQNLFVDNWGDRLKFNEMTLDIELDGTALDMDTISDFIADKLDIDVAPNSAISTLLHLSKENSYHPVREYLERVGDKYKDVDTSILDNLATRYFGSDEPLHNVFMRKCLIAAVARVFKPGVKFDNVVVLQGKQGLRKSSFWQALAVDESWFDDTVTSGGSDKDERMKLRRFWLLELAEIESVFKRKEIASLRGFLTTQNDNIRVPYGRSVKNFPRTSIFVASVNPSEFLVDNEGNRRYWVIPIVQSIPVEMLALERDQLWAAAYFAWKSGEDLELSREMEQRNAMLNREYEVVDSWEEVLEVYLRNYKQVTVTEILSNCLQIELARHDKLTQMRVTECLKRLGWVKDKKRRVNGKVTHIWICPTSDPTPPIPDLPIVEGVNEVATEVITPSNPDPVNISISSISNVATVNTYNSSFHPIEEEEKISPHSNNVVISPAKGVNTPQCQQSKTDSNQGSQSVDTTSDNLNPINFHNYRGLIVGAEVKYVGDRAEYQGMSMRVHQCQYGKVACQQENGYLTTWLEPNELQLK